MSADDPIRRTVTPPLGDDRVRRWASDSTATDGAPDSLSALRKDLNAIINCLAKFLDELPEKTKQLVEARMKASQAEVHAKIAESYGELRGELRGLLVGIRDSLDPQTRTRKAGDFKFAGERTEDSDEVVIDLPAWCNGRTNVN